MRKIVLMLLFWWGCLAHSYGQQPVQPLRGQAVLNPNKIRLRWAPPNVEMWRKGNEQGYTLRRVTIARNRQFLPTPDDPRTLLIAAPQSAAFNLADSAQAAMAGAIFGEYDPDPTQPNGDTLQIVPPRGSQDSLRYALALLFAEQDFTSAKKAALGYEDPNVLAGETYRYSFSLEGTCDSVLVREGTVTTGQNIKDSTCLKIVLKAGFEIQAGASYTAVLSDSLTIGITGTGVVVSLDSLPVLPKPVINSATFGDKSVLLRWHHRPLARYYAAYWIERSTDGVTYTRFSKALFNLTANADTLTLADVLPQNQQPYHYRIVGTTLFDQDGPASNPIVGQGIATFQLVPRIIDIEPTANDEAALRWEIGNEAPDLPVQSIRILKANEANGTYTSVADLAANSRSASVANVTDATYFVVRITDAQGQTHDSAPALVQPGVAQRPSTPTGLVLSGIDAANRTVSFRWNPNPEANTLGYRIYYSNLPRMDLPRVDSLTLAASLVEEPVVLNDTALIATTQYAHQFADSLLNQNLYYYVMAVSKRFAESPLSNALVVTKPDLIPPARPTFTTYQTSSAGVQLNWNASPSNDVSQYRLLRQELPNQTNQDLVNTSALTFTDATAQANKTYRYTLLAFDGAGNQSPVDSLTIVPSSVVENCPPVATLVGVQTSDKKMITLNWTHAQPDVREYQIYRGKYEVIATTLNQPVPLVQPRACVDYVLLGYTAGNVRTFEDPNVVANTFYCYTIRAIFREGCATAWFQTQVNNN